MKKKLLFVLPLLGLLASCGQGSSSVIETSSTPVEGSSVTSSGNTSKSILDGFDKNKKFYKIDMDYTMRYETVKVATGTEAKSVYIGKDKDGFDTQIQFMTGYFTKLSSIDENAENTTTEYSTYYTSNKTYTKQADASYKITNEEHDIKPLLCPFDFSKLQNQQEEVDGFDTTLSGKVNDTDVTAFLGSAIKDSTDISSLSVSVLFYSTDSTLEEISLTYKKGAYDVRQNFSFNTANSVINLPA